MSPCAKCLENKWNFTFNEGWITATCEFCENEVVFASKKLKQQSVGSGEQPKTPPSNKTETIGEERKDSPTQDGSESTLP